MSREKGLAVRNGAFKANSFILASASFTGQECTSAFFNLGCETLSSYL